MNELVEVVLTYLFFFLTYPLTVIGFAWMEPLWCVGWVAIGVGIFFLLRRWAKAIVPIWIALWLMPGTVICGAAMLLPWPVTVAQLGDVGSCSTPSSVVTCLVLNLLVVYGARAGRRWFIRRFGDPTESAKALG